MDELTRAIARFAQGLAFDDIPDRTREIATQIVIDSLACAAGGAGCDAARIGLDLAPVHAGDHGTGRVLFTGECTTADYAAFVNGCMVRYLDYNDSFPTGHPSDCLGAILAVAAHDDVSGARLLTAVVAAYEVHNRLTRAARMRYLGWDQGAAVAVGVAAGLGNLMALPLRSLEHAVSLAAVSCMPMRATRAGNLSLWKGAASAHAAREATFLTHLARLGMTGPSAAFEGRHGLWDLVTGPFEVDPFPPAGPFLIEEVRLKYWPLEYNIQAAVWAALELREKVAPDDVASIEIGTYWSAWHETGSEPEKWAPQNRETADHSMPYVFARAFLDGGIHVESFERAAFTNPDVLDLMSRITVHEDSEIEAMYPETVATRVTVETLAGDPVTVISENPRGHEHNRMSREDSNTKFRRLAEPVLSPDAIGPALEFWWSLPGQSSVRHGLELLRTPAGPTASQDWTAQSPGP